MPTYRAPVRDTQFVFGWAPADAVTSYRYSNDGSLSEVSLPNPTANDTSTVTYRYTFDSLGRPTSIRRPDSAVIQQQSGVDIAYDGLKKTATEGPRRSTW